MVVSDLDLFGIVSGPDEADAPLVVDADAMLAGTITAQRLEPVAGRESQEGEFHRSVDELKFDERPLLDVGRKPARTSALPEFRRLVAGETLDHGKKLVSPSPAVKRGLYVVRIIDQSGVDPGNSGLNW